MFFCRIFKILSFMGCTPTVVSLSLNNFVAWETLPHSIDYRITWFCSSFFDPEFSGVFSGSHVIQPTSSPSFHFIKRLARYLLWSLAFDFADGFCNMIGINM